jgi:LEA14-like dessication related protein
MEDGRWRTAKAILYPLSAIFVLFLTSCATPGGGSADKQAQKQPTIVASIDFYGTDLKFAWELANPVQKEVRLLSYVWELHVDGKRVQRGQSRQVRRVAVGEKLTLEFPVSVKHAALQKLMRTTSLPSRLPYRFIGRANFGVGVKTWGYDLEDEGELNLLASPKFEIQKFHIERMDESRASVAVELLIRNPNTFATRLNNFTADFMLAGQPIAQGVEGPSSEIAANGTAVLPMNLDLNFASLGSVVHHALKQTQGDYTLYGKTEVTTPWGVKKMNYDQSGKMKIER